MAQLYNRFLYIPNVIYCQDNMSYGVYKRHDTTIGALVQAFGIWYCDAMDKEASNYVEGENIEPSDARENIRKVIKQLIKHPMDTDVYLLNNDYNNHYLIVLKSHSTYFDHVESFNNTGAVLICNLQPISFYTSYCGMFDELVATHLCAPSTSSTPYIHHACMFQNIVFCTECSYVSCYMKML